MVSITNSIVFRFPALNICKSRSRGIICQFWPMIVFLGPPIKIVNEEEIVFYANLNQDFILRSKTVRLYAHLNSPVPSTGRKILWRPLEAYLVHRRKLKVDVFNGPFFFFLPYEKNGPFSVTCIT